MKIGDVNDPHLQFLDSVKVTECTGPGSDYATYRLDDVDLDVQAYQLRCHNLEASQLSDIASERFDDVSPQASIIGLPNKEFDGIWESYGLSHCLQES